MDESDPRNAKLCHRLDARSITDDDLRFLQQIGLNWVRLEFGAGEVTLDTLEAAQRRFAQFGMRHALDFEPFLVALMMLAVRQRMPIWGKALVAYSIAVGLWGCWYWQTFVRT